MTGDEPFFVGERVIYFDELHGQLGSAGDVMEIRRSFDRWYVRVDWDDNLFPNTEYWSDASNLRSEPIDAFPSRPLSVTMAPDWVWDTP